MKTTPKRRPRIRSAPLPPLAEIPRQLVAIDASSTAVGWALFRAGNLRAVDVIRGRDLPIEVRSADLAMRVYSLLSGAGFNTADLVVFEAVSGRHGGARPLAVAATAFAQGVTWQATGFFGATRERVAEVDWMRGLRGPLRDKQKRAEWLASAEPVYRLYRETRGDAGCDAADAVALGLWRLGKIGGSEQ